MGWTGAVVMYIVFWFIALFIILPRGQKTQIEQGEIEPGTPGGAPADINIPRKFLWATIAAAAALGLYAGVTETGLLTLQDFDFLFPDSFKEPPAGG